ncbi:MAG: M28 family peptidase, partial [Chloroflexi bacterium]|nr:M28 family peptidase [Chloroflexota bacterium]
MRSSSAFRLLVLALLLCVCVGCLRPGVAFSGVRALRHLEKLCALGPRPVGSSAYVRAGEYIERVLERNGWEVSRQDFAYQGERVRNILGKKGQGPLIIVAAHYDTRPLADRDPADRSQPVVGANDGASGAGVLLELARVLDQDVFQEVQIWLAFLGGEDREEINNWEPAVGAKHLAQSVMASNAQRPEYVLVLNMVGDKDQTLYYEWTSTLWLQEKLFHSAIALGY